MLVPKQIKVKAMCVIKRDNGDVLVTLGHDDVKGEDFGRLLGGHVEFRETSEQALQREFMEELGTRVKKLTFLKCIENIFTYKGEDYHEIDFIYSGELEDSTLYSKEDMHVLDSPEVKVRWISPKDIESGKIKIYPKYD